MNLVMKKAGMTDYSTDYTYGYTTGYLGMRLRLRRGENAPALRMAVRLPRTDHTGVFKDVVKPSNVKHQPGLINMGKYAPALRMTVRMTRTMREQRNRDLRSRRVTRYALQRRVTRYALQRVNKTASKFRKKKNGQGEMIRYLYLLFLFLSPWSFVSIYVS